MLLCSQAGVILIRKDKLSNELEIEKIAPDKKAKEILGGKISNKGNNKLKRSKTL